MSADRASSMQVWRHKQACSIVHMRPGLQTSGVYVGMSCAGLIWISVPMYACLGGLASAWRAEYGHWNMGVWLFWAFAYRNNA